MGEEKKQGHELSLPNGAKVALFRNTAPGENAVLFVSPEGSEVMIGLSDHALQALVSLIVSDSGKTWRLA